MVRGRNATGTRSLIVDVGLDKGAEFFHSIAFGYEVVGFEANPLSFAALKNKCVTMPTKCQAIDDIENHELPLKREVGMSYLINAGAGNKRGHMDLALKGDLGSFAPVKAFENVKKASVPVLRVDSVIDEDVYLFKIDTQGFDHFVLEGATGLFEKHTVRQIITEFEPLEMKALGVNIMETLKMLQQHGMICFSDKSFRHNEKHCRYNGDSAEGYSAKYFAESNVGRNRAYAPCWDDLLCINIKKIYSSPIPLLA